MDASNWPPGPAEPGADASLTSFLDTLPVAAYVCDTNGLITYFNDLAAALWGRVPVLNSPADRFCGSFKLLSDAGGPIAREECWMALALGSGKDYLGHEIIIERPDGERRRVLANARTLRHSDGRLAGAVNVLVDLTDQSTMEETRARLAAIVESSDDAIVSKTLDGVILSWNAAAERMFGYTASEVIGRSITIIIPPERHGEEESILARLRRGERVSHLETIRMRKDGQRIEISVTSSPVRDSSGRIIGVSKVARDITIQNRIRRDLVATQGELRGQLAGFRRLHEMGLALAATRDRDRILRTTVETAAAIDDTDLALLFLVAPSGRLEVAASVGFSDALIATFEPLDPGTGASGRAMQARSRIVVQRIDDDPSFDRWREAARPVGVEAVHCTPLITPSGELIGVVSTLFRHAHRPSQRQMDLTDLCVRQAVASIENARLYDELSRADQAKNEFLATLAHELRNPLAPLRNAAHILRQSGTTADQSGWAVDVIDRQLGQMTRLVDDLMDLARITSNKLELRRERVELARVLKIAIEASRPGIEARQHRLSIREPEDPIHLDGDPTRLAQVISNLLNNAAKYTEPGGRIWLVAERDGVDVVVSVRDTGIGIPAELQGAIFQMFSQGHRGVEREEGLGIGLTLVKRLVEMHGGTVVARSPGPGAGSEFVVRLPIQAASSVHQAGEGSPSSDGTAPRRLRILLADDNRDAVDSLGTLLRMFGHHVRTAYDGLQAVSEAQAFRPQVVLLDLGMPALDGHAAARRIRGELGNGVVLIAVTGWGQEADQRRSKDAGFDRHLVKPVDPSLLLRMLESPELPLRA